MGQRKPLTIVGYGLAAISKPLLGLAGSWAHVFAARLLDRTGKGLRATPRDALITEKLPAQPAGTSLRSASQHGHHGRGIRAAGRILLPADIP